MKMATFTIYGRLDGLNAYTKECRANRYAGARLKKNNEQLVKCAAQPLIPSLTFDGKKKVHLYIDWYEKDKRRDLDNVAFAKKFIQDALVDMGVLAGDGWKYIEGFTDRFFIDKELPRVVVIIQEVA